VAISINSNPNNVNYQNVQNQTPVQAANGTGQPNTNAQLFSELLQLSSEMSQDSGSSPLSGGLAPLSMALSNQGQSGSSPLTADEMNTFLSSFLDNLSLGDATGSTDGTSSQDDLLSGDQLLGVDPSNSSNDQILGLLNQLTNNVQNSQAAGQDSAFVDQSGSDTGFPPILQVSGATLPPFDWKPGSGSTQKA
jgi:hypothetical protein